MEDDFSGLEFETDIFEDSALNGNFTKPEFWIDL